MNGFRGPYCQVGPTPCASNPCVNGGVCKEIVGGKGYSCMLKLHFRRLCSSLQNIQSDDRAVTGMGTGLENG